MHSIKQIQIVKALAEHRHFGRAAVALGVSQPNLTRSLKHKEDVLGVKLFDRQGVTPTLFGEMVLRHGERSLSDFQELFREISLAKGLEIGELRISVAPYPADVSGAAAVGKLLKTNPKLIVEFRNVNWADAVVEVVEGVTDLAFAELSAASANGDVDVEPIRSSQMIFFCAADHPLAVREKLVVNDLLEFPWAGPSLPGRMGEALPKGDLPFAIYDRQLDRLHPRALV
jgi:DNA-binding transcriptional LysR family regulator